MNKKILLLTTCLFFTEPAKPIPFDCCGCYQHLKASFESMIESLEFELDFALETAEQRHLLLEYIRTNRVTDIETLILEFEGQNLLSTPLPWTQVTPMHHAVRHATIPTIERLVELGGQLEKNMLHIASNTGRLDMHQYLSRRLRVI